jgi:GNAT superfamily N-acetyltransferase
MVSARDNVRTMSTQATKYAVRAADVVRDQAFPSPAKHPIKYDWCYGSTPQGVGRLYLLEYGDNAAIIGVQGIVPRCWWLHGETKATGICADLVVDQHYRSIGPALAMVRQVVEIEQGLPNAVLLYGFPNLNSEALYRRAGYTKMGEITRYSQPLRLRVWLRRKGVPSLLAQVAGRLADLVSEVRAALVTVMASRYWRCIPAEEFDSRFDALWSRVAVNAGPMVIRNGEYLRWRFGNNFAGQTQVMVLARDDGSLDGYVVYMVNANKMVTILDFLAVDNAKALPAMLSMFVRAMYKQGYHGIMLEFSGPKSISDILIQSGFLPRESNPIYAILGDASSGLVQGTEPYFTSSDRDQ